MYSRRRTKAERRELVADFDASGLTQEVFARSKGFKVGTFRSWVYKIRGASKEPRFAELVKKGTTGVEKRHASKTTLLVGEVGVEFVGRDLGLRLRRSETPTPKMRVCVQVERAGVTAEGSVEVDLRGHVGVVGVEAQLDLAPGHTHARHLDAPTAKGNGVVLTHRSRRAMQEDFVEVDAAGDGPHVSRAHLCQEMLLGCTPCR